MQASSTFALPANQTTLSTPILPPAAPKLRAQQPVPEFNQFILPMSASQLLFREEGTNLQSQARVSVGNTLQNSVTNNGLFGIQLPTASSSLFTTINCPTQTSSFQTTSTSFKTVQLSSNSAISEKQEDDKCSTLSGGQTSDQSVNGVASRYGSYETVQKMMEQNQ